MRRFSFLRSADGVGSKRRVIIAGTTLALFAGTMAAAQVATAAEKEDKNPGSNAESEKRKDKPGKDGGSDKGSGDAVENKDLDVLATNCEDSKLKVHDGFQKGNRCVDVSSGEVSSAKNNPSLLIVDAPDQVQVDKQFSLSVATDNLVRNRFLAAADGGYLAESSLLNKQGLQTGHVHTACRMLDGNRMPDPAAQPDFFVATEDNKGGADPDVFKVQVTGLSRPGVAQCSVWAGSGMHSLPMMERANQTPAFDTVRIKVVQ